MERSGVKRYERSMQYDTVHVSARRNSRLSAMKGRDERRVHITSGKAHWLLSFEPICKHVIIVCNIFCACVLGTVLTRGLL